MKCSILKLRTLKCMHYSIDIKVAFITVHHHLFDISRAPFLRFTPNSLPTKHVQSFASFQIQKENEKDDLAQALSGQLSFSNPRGAPQAAEPIMPLSTRGGGEGSGMMGGSSEVDGGDYERLLALRMGELQGLGRQRQRKSKLASNSMDLD